MKLAALIEKLVGMAVGLMTVPFCVYNDDLCIKMMFFALKMMNFVLHGKTTEGSRL